MKRRAFLSAVAGLAQIRRARPNIVLVMADDQGWGDVGFNGHPVVKTPHLDAMAREGVRLNRFYSGAPVCSPTRGSCLTGRHPFRYGIYFANAGREGQASEYALPAGERTIAEVLRPLGYRTGHFGKWHLGDFDGPKQSSPTDNGFTEWFSTVRKVPTADPPSREYWKNGVEVTRPLRGDDSKIILDEAVEFLEKAVQAKEPFLCVIWFHAPHLPLVATPEYRRLYAEHPESKQHYWGAITALDTQVGRLRAKLREWGVARDTMLWYASDNGPEGDAETVEFPGTAGPLRGRKASLFEGGVRVPAIVEWPARWKGKRTIGAPCSTSDYFPTILAALELQAPDARPIDGASLLPLLDGKAKQRGSALAFETTKITRGSPRLAWVEDRWKLLTNLDASEDLLFDLQADPGEKRNLAASQPAEVARMRQALTVWRESCRRSVRGEDYQP